MRFVWDPIYFVNLVLCILILVFGFVGWRRSAKKHVLYVGLAFGLFGLSHLATLLGLKDSLATVLIIVRTVAYLLVTFALYKVAFTTE